MKTNDTASNLLLAGCALLASVDYSNLVDLAFRTILTGGIWLGYKVIGDQIAARKNNKNNGKD